MNNEDRLPESVIRQAANELLVARVLTVLYQTSLALARDCDISQVEANAILVEKLVQFTTKHPSRMINPDVGAIYFNIEIVDTETVNYTPVDNGPSDIGSLSWCDASATVAHDDNEDDSDNEGGLFVAA